MLAERTADVTQRVAGFSKRCQSSIFCSVDIPGRPVRAIFRLLRTPKGRNGSNDDLQVLSHLNADHRLARSQAVYAAL